MFVEALRYDESQRRSYDLSAWVVMPNHVHIVIEPHQPLSEIMRWLKAATANRANKIIGLKNTPFWQREYTIIGFALRRILLDRSLRRKKSGIRGSGCALAEDWPWSSANKSAGGKTTSGTLSEEMTTVVAGVLERDGKILICRRRADQPHPLKWEFPGGKLETGESPAAALIRELREELGIESEAGVGNHAL